MATLCVNIDHIATLRQARRTVEPEPVAAACIVEMAGSTGVTVHLREDERHIQERDVRLLREIVRGHLNLEMAASEAMASRAIGLAPDIATLVPERREEVTTEGGLDVVHNLVKVREITARLSAVGIEVSLFIDPTPEQIDASHRCGASQVELHTGRYCDARTRQGRLEELRKLIQAGEHARRLGLILNAGHGLNYRNVAPVAAIEGMRELNIGHSIVSRAVFVGLSQAVAEMERLIRAASHHPEAYRPDTL